jgi:hypothetical protein
MPWITSEVELAFTKSISMCRGETGGQRSSRRLPPDGLGTIFLAMEPP